MKTFLLSLLTILLPFVANADAVEIDGIYYNLVKKAKIAEVTSNPNKYSGSVDIPGTVTYDGVEYSVTSIGSEAFSFCNSLTTVTIPNSVTSIGGEAFYGCSNLFTVDIPDSLESIQGATFSHCSNLDSVSIPNSVTSIGNFAFSECSSLTSINIPNSVTSLGIKAFFGCYSLASINIGDGLKCIDEDAFSGCSGLTLVNITSISAWCAIHFSNDSSNPIKYAQHISLNGDEIKDLIIPNNVTSIERYAFYCCSSIASITIFLAVAPLLLFLFLIV